jgi:hypothetical protein
VPGGTHAPLPSPHPFVYGAITRSGRPFQWRSTRRRVGNSVGGAVAPQNGRTTPHPHRPTGHSADTVWALRVSLAATPHILSLPQGTEMFQFPRSPPLAYVFSQGRRASRPPDCSIRVPSAHRVATAPRGVSPPARALRRPSPPRHPPRAHQCVPIPSTRRNQSTRGMSQSPIAASSCPRWRILRPALAAIAQLSTYDGRSEDRDYPGTGRAWD